MPRVRVLVPVETPKAVQAAIDEHQSRALQVAPQPTVPEPVLAAPVEVTKEAEPLLSSYVETEQAEPSGIHLSRRSIGVIAASFLIFSLFAVGVAINIGREPSDKSVAIQALTDEERYYQEVSKLVELPEGQTPQVLNISDSEAVKKDNVALGDIKNGDKMLFFTQARKVVVYRPNTKKVVAVVSLAAPDKTTPATKP